jgi:RHS repeat-associated protein
VLVINSAGLVIENNRTLPYGEAWLAENTPSTNDKKFTTYQRDQESRLDYAMNRYYANTAGRFASPDKGKLRLFLPASLNRYSYVGADPINRTDSTVMIGNVLNSFQGTPYPREGMSILKSRATGSAVRGSSVGIRRAT